MVNVESPDSGSRDQRLRVAAVVAKPVFGPAEREANIGAARGYVADAAARGAALVCLPETFPGAWRAPVTWTPEAELGAMARDAGVYLVGGFAEPAAGDSRRCYNTLALFGPDGAEIGRYRRTLPRHAPWIYRGGRYWDFDWVPAEDLPVFDTDLGVIGLLVCSEVYSPELARILALKGAEIILMPAGLAGPQRHTSEYSGDALLATWRTLAWARAIENLAYTVICSNVPDQESLGLALVCAPEDIVLEEHAAGVHTADLDLGRVRWLREQQDRVIEGPALWRAKPGVLRDWRRKEIFAANPVLFDD